MTAETPLQISDAIERPGKRQQAEHGFVDVLLSRRPHPDKAGIYIHEGAISARSTLEAQDLTATLRLAWDNRLVVRVNDGRPIIEVPLRNGKNLIDITLNNTQNFNHRGWVFAFKATTPEGTALIPRAE